MIFGAPQGPQPAVLNADATSLTVLEGLLSDDDPSRTPPGSSRVGDFEAKPAQAALLLALDEP